MNSKRNALLMALFCALPSASNLQAQYGTMDVFTSGSGLSGTMPLPKFDPSLGTLFRVNISETLNMTVNFTCANASTDAWIYNPNPSNLSVPGGVGYDSSGISTGSSGVTLYFNSPSTNIYVPAGSGYQYNGYDTIYGTAAGFYVITGTNSGALYAGYNDNTMIAPFIGTGTLNLTFHNYEAEELTNPQYRSYTLSPVASATFINVDVTYYYWLPVPSVALAQSAGLPSLQLSGQLNTTNLLEYKDNLSSTQGWTVITNVVFTTSPITFVDQSATNAVTRFYRCVPAP